MEPDGSSMFNYKNIEKQSTTMVRPSPKNARTQVDKKEDWNWSHQGEGENEDQLSYGKHT